MDTSPVALYKYFVERIRDNLHVIVTISPIGDKLKRYLRTYPTLLKMCTLDWMTAWPDDAIQFVAEQFVATMHLTPAAPVDANDDNDGVPKMPQDELKSDSIEVHLTEYEKRLVGLILHFNQTIRETNVR